MATPRTQDTASAPPDLGRAPAASRWIVSFLVLAALLRVVVFLVSARDPSSRQLEEDSQGYLQLASNLRTESAFGRFRATDPGGAATWVPELVRTPGYPAIVAGVDVLTGNRQAATILLQHLLCVVLAAWMATVAFRLFGPSSAVLAVALMALDLQSIALANMMLTETVYGFLLFAAMLATAGTMRQGSRRLAALAGLLLGLSVLVRPTSILLPLLAGLALGILGAKRRSMRMVVAALLLSGVGAAIEGAWIVRNGLVAGEYTLTTLPRSNLFFYHAAKARARSEDRSVESVGEEMASSLGLTQTQIHALPMSPPDRTRVTRAALQTIWRYRGSFAAESLTGAANSLFGPEKNLLKVLGWPWISFGVSSGSSGSPAAHASARAWFVMGLQLVWLAIVYLLVLRALLGSGLPPVVWTSLGFVLYVLLVSAGYNDPRFRSPLVPLLILVAASAVRTRPRPGPLD